jgi:hypothetical protein
MAEANSVTTIFAIYGALVSSFNVGWNFYRDLKDKARLKISMHIRRLVLSPDGKVYQVQPDLAIEGASEKLFLVVNVTNIGHRPVKWTGWGGKWRDPTTDGGSFIIQPVHLPVMLVEGESSSEMTDDLASASKNVKELFIYDAPGKNWYLSRRALRKLKEECRKFQRGD